MSPRIGEGNSLVGLLMAADRELRQGVPKCQVCGLSTGGIMFAGQSAAEAGICIRADHVGKRKHYCPSMSLMVNGDLLIEADKVCPFCGQ